MCKPEIVCGKVANGPENNLNSGAMLAALPKAGGPLLGVFAAAWRA